MTRPTLTVVPSSHTRRRLATVIGTAAACLLTVTACDGSEATPPPSPTTSSSSTPPSTTPSTPTTTPKPPPPTMPPAASAGFTVSSAEAFARFYLAAREHAALTGDTTLMRKWAGKTCSLCTALASSYDKQYKDGGSITGDVHFKVSRVVRARLTGTNLAEVVLTGRVGRFVDVDTATAQPSVYPGGISTFRFALTRSDGHWLVYGMALI